MKKTAIIVGMLILVASSAFAASGDMWFGVQGGMSIPTSDMADVVKTGWDGSVWGSYGVAKSCAVGLELGYHNFKGKGDNGDKLTVTPMQASVFSTYAFPMKDSKSMPYVKLGLGLYDVKVKIDLPDPDGYDKSYNKFGGNFGVGYNYEVSPMYSVGLNGAVHYISGGDDFKKADGSKYNPIVYTVGLNLNFGMKKK